MTDGGVPALSVRHLSKRFGDRVAVDDITFDVARGEIFGFLGPNGAGKTTTVRALGTLARPDGGLGGVAGSPDPGERRRDPPAHRDHARVAGPLPPPDREREPRVLRRPVRGAGHPRAHRPRPSRGQPRRAGNDLCGALSKGLRQRVGLARALLSDPRYCSSTSRRPASIRSLLGRSTNSSSGFAQRGVTIFLTTHRLEEAERLCDRVAIIKTSLRVDRSARGAPRPALPQDARPSGRCPARGARSRLRGLPGGRGVASWTAGPAMS